MKLFAQLINKLFGWRNLSRWGLELGKDLELQNEMLKGGGIVDNQKILNQAIELLKGLDLTNAESVQINNTKYDDGSSLIEVGVSYPATAETDEK